MLKKIKDLFLAEEGQGMTEYGLVLGVIAIGVVATLVLLREQIVQLFKNVLTAITGATPTP
ncbi:MAG TPA: Flp family type IVb pilin [Bacillales bacterium]|nr:Flp family type IVb pilin [Bacillales bacterium]